MDLENKTDIRKELNDFCSTTTAHGFVHFTGKEKSKKLLWGIICLGMEMDVTSLNLNTHSSGDSFQHLNTNLVNQIMSTL